MEHQMGHRALSLEIGAGGWLEGLGHDRRQLLLSRHSLHIIRTETKVDEARRRESPAGITEGYMERRSMIMPTHAIPRSGTPVEEEPIHYSSGIQVYRGTYQLYKYPSHLLLDYSKTSSALAPVPTQLC